MSATATRMAFEPPPTVKELGGQLYCERPNCGHHISYHQYNLAPNGYQGEKRDTLGACAFATCRCKHYIAGER